MKIILDTGFLSSLVKIGKLQLIKDFFGVGGLYIPKAVLNELSRGKPLETPTWIRVAKSKGLKRPDLGLGESEAISLAKETGSILLIDDRRARDVAVGLGVVTFDLPTFLLACKERGLLNKQEVKGVIEGLKERDYYIFETGVEEELLR
jgi:predicted nucleic acid-binding protein